MTGRLGPYSEIMDRTGKGKLEGTVQRPRRWFEAKYLGWVYGYWWARETPWLYMQNSKAGLSLHCTYSVYEASKEASRESWNLSSFPRLTALLGDIGRGCLRA